MPTRGYRKGRDDTKEPLPHFVRTRLSNQHFQWLKTDADNRAMTVSKLTRAAIIAYLTGQRTQIPRHNPNAEFLRELARIGNNLNQLSRHANTGTIAVPTGEILDCLDRLNRLARSFG